MKLYLKGDRCNTAKCVVVRKPSPPGEYGKYPPRLIGYAAQLREKQKLKKIYGVMEAQLRRLYRLASKDPKNKSTRLLQLLEMRLDNVLYRLGFASSRNQARQIIRHGFVKIDGEKVDIPSYEVKPKQEIQLAEKIMKQTWYQEMEAKRRDYKPPAWLGIKERGVGVVVQEPTREMMEPGLREDFVIEFYSR